MDDKSLNIPFLLEKLSEKRPVFHSEADFQLELGWLIKEYYPHATVRMEYCPAFDTGMHIDILVIINKKWIPIELKYKTKACEITVDGELFHLKNHAAKNLNCYRYLYDICRIEQVKNSVPELFAEGYTVFITNETGYQNPPRGNCYYEEFSVHETAVKTGTMRWIKTPDTKDIKESIKLQGSYPIHWNSYSTIDDQAFVCLVNAITK